MPGLYRCDFWNARRDKALAKAPCLSQGEERRESGASRTMGPFGLTASFETPAFGGLLRMRAEVANAARARLASYPARPRESGDPVLDSRLRGNERSMLRARSSTRDSPIQLSNSQRSARRLSRFAPRQAPSPGFLSRRRGPP